MGLMVFEQLSQLFIYNWHKTDIQKDIFSSEIA